MPHIRANMHSPTGFTTMEITDTTHIPDTIIMGMVIRTIIMVAAMDITDSHMGRRYTCRRVRRTNIYIKLQHMQRT